jgi:hypothetical protein
MSRIHRELLKQQLMNYDYSKTPVNKMILVELDCSSMTVQSEGPQGFTHYKTSGGSLGNLIDLMNRRVKQNPDYDLIIVDRSDKVW